MSLLSRLKNGEKVDLLGYATRHITYQPELILPQGFQYGTALDNQKLKSKQAVDGASNAATNARNSQAATVLKDQQSLVSAERVSEHRRSEIHRLDHD